MRDQQYSILLVDDSESDRRIFRRYLEQMQMNLEIHETNSVKDAIAFCERNSPNCILLDFRLPDATGLEALETIRTLTESPVIFVSGNPEPAVITRAFRGGAITYLSKDLLTRESLADAVRLSLGETSA